MATAEVTTRQTLVAQLTAGILIVLGLFGVLVPSVEDPYQAIGALLLTLGSILLSWTATGVRRREDAVTMLKPELDTVSGRLSTVSGQMAQNLRDIQENVLDHQSGILLVSQSLRTLAGIVNDLQVLTGSRFDSQELLSTFAAIEDVGRELQVSAEMGLSTADATAGGDHNVLEAVDRLQSLLLQARSNVRNLEEPTRKTSVERAECPYCGHDQEVRIGTVRGDTATTVCSLCGERFNTHRDPKGGVFTRKFGPAEEEGRELACPACDTFVFRWRAKPGEVVNRFCLECFARVRLDPSAPTVIAPADDPVEADYAGRNEFGTRSLLKCPSCSRTRGAFVVYNDRLYSECLQCGHLMVGDQPPAVIAAPPQAATPEAE